MSDKKKPVLTNLMDMDPTALDDLLQTPAKEKDEDEDEAPTLGQQEPFRGNILAGWIAGQYPVDLD